MTTFVPTVIARSTHSPRAHHAPFGPVRRVAAAVLAASVIGTAPLHDGPRRRSGPGYHLA